MFFTPPPPPLPIYHPITILVHGTRPSAISNLGLPEPMMKKLDETTACPPGLSRADALPNDNHFRTLACELSGADPQQFPFDTCYIFGWSGDLDARARLHESHQLHTAIKELLREHETNFRAPPTITLITHSHGGNLVLNMAAISNEPSFIIERLLLLACPVQHETVHLVDKDHFKNVYALYSHHDLIQVLDPQKLQPLKHGVQQCHTVPTFYSALEILYEAYAQAQEKPLFSERYFQSSKVIHIEVSASAPLLPIVPGPLAMVYAQLNKAIFAKTRGFFHHEFITPLFMKNLPTILARAEQHRLARSAEAGHLLITL